MGIYVLNSLYNITLNVDSLNNQLIFNMPKNTGIIHLGSDISRLFSNCYFLSIVYSNIYNHKNKCYYSFYRVNSILIF